MSMSESSTIGKLFVNISEIKKNLPKAHNISSKTNKDSFDGSPGRLGSQTAVKEKTKLHKKSYTELNNLYFA